MFASIAELVSAAETSGQPLAEVVIQAEAEQSRTKPAVLRQRMQQRPEVMRSSSQEGLERPVVSLSGLSGGNAY